MPIQKKLTTLPFQIVVDRQAVHFDFHVRFSADGSAWEEIGAAHRESVAYPEPLQDVAIPKALTDAIKVMVDSGMTPRQILSAIVKLVAVRGGQHFTGVEPEL